MTILDVISAGDACQWEGGVAQLLSGVMDIRSLVGPDRIGHSRRYPIGVRWARAANAEATDEEVDDSFLILKDVEVRLIYEDPERLEPTPETQQSLPAAYVVPTMGTQDLNAPPVAVFDLIPTWVAERLAMDAVIWDQTSRPADDPTIPGSDSAARVIAPGKDYILATEFRLRGETAGGKKVVSNWFRWVIRLCRGCKINFTATPPRRPALGRAVFPGHYAGDDLSLPEPLPAQPGLIAWCNAGVSQGLYVLDLVQPSQPLVPRDPNTLPE